MISSIYKSILRSVHDLMEHLNGLGRWSVIGYHDWQERGEEENLPPQPLIGLGEFAFTENDGRWLITVAIGFSTYKDENLHNEIEIISEIQKWFGEGNKVALLDELSGLEYNELVVTAFSVLPMSQSEYRNYRTLGVELKRTGT